MTDFSVYPFYDDFETSAKGKDYHKILFVPGNAVQARELTQIQSILQEQIKRHGDAIFKNGTVIQSGNLFYDNSITYLKLAASYGSSTTSSLGPSLVGKTLVGSSGVSAHVVHYEPGTATDPDTIFIKYNGANGTVHNFTLGEVISSADLNASFQIFSATGSIGLGSIVSINDGIYYVNGYFVGVAAQTIVLDKYSSTPSYVAGLTFTESVVTAADDGTLYDNALGFPNYAAPGASRYKITLVLDKKNSDYTDISGQTLISFIPLLKIVNGLIQFDNNVTEYSAIEKMLARRTFDEAGDFIVKDFKISSKNFRSNNRGQWTTSTAYIIGDVVTNAGIYYIAKNNGYSGSTAPVHAYGAVSDGVITWLEVANPSFNNGLNNMTSTVLADHIAADSQLAILTSPGKAYVQGFEINVQDSRTTQAKKARDIEQKTDIQIYAPAGSYALISNVTGLVDTGTMTPVSLKDPGGTVRGTAYATAMEFVSGTPGTAGAQYRLYLINISMNAGYDFIDDILTVVDTATGTAFAGTFVQGTSVLSGFVTTTAANATVTGKGTLFTQELKAGDQIQINGVANVVQTVNSDSSLTLTTTYASSLTDVPIYGLTVKLVNVGHYITKLPNEYMRNMREADGTLDTAYTVLRTLTTPAVGGTSYVYTLAITGEVFDGTSGIILIDAATNAVVNATYSLDITATQLTIGGLTTGHSYKFSAKVRRSGIAAREKTKTLTTRTIIVNAGNITDDANNVLSTAWNFKSSVISLTKCDVQRVIKVTMSGAKGVYNATGETDVTQWFTLNRNSKPDFYDISTITRKSRVVPPSRALKVTFEYFEHSAGDYFSIDSYIGVPYGLIPVEKHGDITYNLRDCIDYRSRVADTGVGFSGTGGNVSTPLSSSSTIQTSYSYYLPRTDVLSISASGAFEYILGQSSLTPTAPQISDGSLQLAIVELKPYTIGDSDVTITPTQHRRYTMSDISLLDNRLSNVEYYVALNELEKKTSSMQIYDRNGLSRYKNGFIAEPFNSFDVSDVTSPDFKCSIDLASQELRPSHSAEKIPLAEPAGTTTSSRKASGYQVTGDWITLPYTEKVLIAQPFATRSENINPFAVFSWNGFAKLTPEKDTWVDTAVNQNVINVTGSTQRSTMYQYVYVGGGGGGSIICTRLFELGLMDAETYKLDSEFGAQVRKTHMEVYAGYITLATPIVKLMHREDWIGKASVSIVKVFALPWANEMARRLGAERKFNLFGWMVMEVGSKVCAAVGHINKVVKDKTKVA